MLRRGTQLYRTLTTLSGWNADIVVTPPTWRVRCMRWLVAVTVLSIAYQAYALLVVPVIEPGPGVQRPRDQVELPLATDAHPELAELFPEGAWERGRPMVLTTQWGKLLFREYRTADGGRLELSPCTIVFYAPTRGKQGVGARRAVVLQTPDKAVLSFSGPLNLVRAEFTNTKLKGARLEGEVKIWSRESRPGAKDALSIVTRNVQILPEQIWTAHDVTFQYGASHGRGRDLSITLSQSGATSSKNALVRNLESLELAHIEKLTFQIPDQKQLGDLLPPSATRLPPPAATVPPTHAATDDVNVTCRGPFKFDFQQSLASLDDHVDVVHENAAGESDQLSCDRLLIYFESPSDTAATDQTTSTTPTDDHAVVQKLAVRRIEAHGFPATLRVTSLAAMARGQQLSYDFQTRRILLVDEQNASLAYREHQAEAPRLEYELQAEPKRLGHLWATGPGIYQGQFGDGPERRLTARWCGVLELQPQEGLHVLSIVEGADIAWNEMGNFAADELYVWLAEVPVPDPVAPSPPPDPLASDIPAGVELAPAQPEAVLPAPPPPAAPPAPTRFEIRPVKMLAQGNVSADTKQFQGKTPRLEIWFDHPDGASPSAGEASRSEDAAPEVVPSPTPPGLPATKDRGQQLKLTGDWIRLRLRMTPTRPKVHEATVVGNVSLSQLSPIPGDLSLLITGEMLQLRTDLLDRSAVDVNGTPAHVHAQGMLWEGSNLHLSQRENRLWAEGPGRMKLPTRELTSAPDAPPAAPPAAPVPNTPVWIGWQGGMDFDGQLVRFVRQVEVRGIYSADNGDRLHARAIGDQLHATFNRYVSLEQTRSRDDLDVVELRFLGDVFTENQTFSAQDVIISRDRIKTRDLTLDRRTGQFHAVGPGWITSTRYDTTDIRSSIPGTTSGRNANDTWTRSGSSRLVYLRVDYQNEIEGNIDQREAVLQHYVRAVYGPVQSWDQVLDPDQRGGLGPQGIVMTCQRLFVTEAGEAPQRGLELSAVGNTLVEGSTFTAKAQRLSYVQAKDQLVLDGESGLAQLQQQQRQGGKPTEFSARQIKYNVSTGHVEVFGATQLDYTHIGKPDMPNTPKARLR